MPNNNVDERIVEMRIDHEKFEAGAKKAISILEKLDKSLDGLNDVGSDGLDKVADSLEIVNKRFSAMGIVGDQVIRNLTNKAMELVGQMTRLGKSLTIDQVGAGWSQYADKTAAVQTIMAATANEFENQAEQIEVVNAQLDRLITFADETSYSFLDMTSNVGKFTSNGMGLEESVTAMQGISTWAALSGANVGEASRAMYNLSQALATGAVKLIDWKSIENANMATREFKQTALDTAVALGTLTKTADGMYKTQQGHVFAMEQFNTQLSDQWFSSDVLMKTLDTYGAFSVVMTDAIDDTGELARDILKALDEYRKTGKATEELLPWLEKLGAAEMELGEKAFRAAQETKTFREMIDATQDAARTKWMSIFELMFGGYLEAKQFWSNAAEEMYTIFVDPLNNLIDIFEVAFGEGDDGATGQITTLEDALKSAGRTLEDFEVAFFDVDSITLGNLIREYGTLEEAINKGAVGADLFKKVLTQMSKTTGHGSVGKAIKSVDEQIAEMREVATGVLRGDYGAGEERKRILTELGYDYDMIQWIAETMVGEPQTDTKTLLSRYKPEWLQQIEETASAAGHTDAEIEAMNYMLQNASDLLAEIEAGAEDAGEELRDMVHSMSGRALLTGGIQNLLHFFADLTTVITNASNALFGGPDGISNAIHRVLEDFYIFTASIQLGEDRVEELSNGFSTLSGILHYIGAAFMGVVRFGGKIVKFIFDTVKGIIEIIRQSGALRAFGQALLTIFGALTVPLMLIGELIGNLIKRFRSTVGKRWGSALMDIFTALADKITIAATHIKEFFESSEVAEWITDKFAKLEAIVSKVSKRVQFFFGALKLGYKKNGISGIFSALTGQFRLMLSQHPKLLGVFDTIARWIGRISDAASRGYGAVRDWFANFSFSNIKVSMPSFQQVVEFVLNIFKNVVSWVSGLIKGEKLTEISDAIKAAFANVNISKTLNEFVDAIKTFFSEKLGITLFENSFFDNMWEFIDGLWAVIAALGSGALVLSLHKLIKNLGGFFGSLDDLIQYKLEGKKPNKLKNFAQSVLLLAGSVLIIVYAVKMLGDMNDDQIMNGFTTITSFLTELVSFTYALKVAGKGSEKGARGVLELAVGVFILAITMKKISELTDNQISRGFTGLLDLVLVMVLIMHAGANIEAKGLGQLFKVALGFLVLGLTLKLLSKMPYDQMGRGFLALLGIVGILILISRGAGNIQEKGLGQLLKVAIGLGVFVLLMKVVSRMKVGKILKGLVVLGAIMLLIVEFTKRADSIADKGLNKLLGVAASLLIFTLVFKSLSHMKFGAIVKATIALWVIIGQVTRLTRKTGSIQDKGLGKLIAVAIALLGFTLAFKALGHMKFGDILKGIIALWLIVNQVIKLTNKLGTINGNFASLLTLLGIAALLGGIVTALIFLANVPFNKLLGAVVALTITLSAVGGLMKNLNKITGKINWAALANLLAILGALWGVAAILKWFSNENWAQMGGSALILVATLYGIILSIKSLNKASPSVKGLLSYVGLAAAIVALWGIGVVLSQFKDQNWAQMGKIALVLVGTLLALVGVLAVIGLVASQAITGAVALGVIIVLFTAVVWAVVHLIGEIAKTGTKTAEQLNKFIEALEPFLETVKGVSGDSATGAQNLATVMLGIAQSAFWAFLGTLLSYLVNGQATAARLSKFVTDIEPFLTTISSMNIDSSTAEKASAFSAVMEAIAGATKWELVASFLQNFKDNHWPDVEVGESMSKLARDMRPFINATRDYSEADAKQVGYFVAVMRKVAAVSLWNTISAVLLKWAEMTNVNVGKNMSALARNMRKFVDSTRDYSETDATQAGYFVAVMRKVASASLWQMVSSFLGAATEWTKVDVGENMSGLAEGMKPFIESVRTYYKEDDATKAGYFSNIMAAVAGVTIWEAVANFLTWATSFVPGDAGANMSKVAEDMMPFVAAIQDVSKDDADKAGYFASVMEKIAVVSIWGAVAQVFDSIKPTFGLRLSSFMTMMKPFFASLENDVPKENIAEGAMDTINNILKSVVEAQFWGLIGDYLAKINEKRDSWTNLSQNLTSMMEGIAPFFTSMTSITEANVGSTEKVLDVIDRVNSNDSLMNFAVQLNTGHYQIPDEQSLNTLFNAIKRFFEVFRGIANAGYSNINDLTDVMSNVGTNTIIKKFMDDLSKAKTLDSDKRTNIFNAVGVFFTTLSNVASNGYTGVKTLADILKYVGEEEAISSFMSDLNWAKDYLPDTQNRDNMLGAIAAFFDAFRNIANAGYTGVKGVAEVMAYVGQNKALSTFMNDVQDATIKIPDITVIEQFERLANLLETFLNMQTAINQLANDDTGIRTTIYDVINNAIIAVGADAANPATTLYTNETTLGGNIVIGIVDGIYAKQLELTTAAQWMASTINTAFANSPDIDAHSPSRAFAVLGGYLPAGIAQGVAENIGIAEDSMTVLGSAILAAIQQAMLNVATVADDNYEFHPTITPVVDLSNVNAASGAVSGAFNGNYGISAQMSASVNRRMSDIERLAANVNGVGGQTVNGDNITVNVYPSPGQDPEAIADAVINRINSRSIRRGVAFG